MNGYIGSTPSHVRINWHILQIELREMKLNNQLFLAESLFGSCQFSSFNFQLSVHLVNTHHFLVHTVHELHQIRQHLRMWNLHVTHSIFTASSVSINIIMMIIIISSTQAINTNHVCFQIWFRSVTNSIAHSWFNTLSHTLSPIFSGSGFKPVSSTMANLEFGAESGSWISFSLDKTDRSKRGDRMLYAIVRRFVS